MPATKLSEARIAEVERRFRVGRVYGGALAMLSSSRRSSGGRIG
jgi:hypothetical protein